MIPIARFESLVMVVVLTIMDIEVNGSCNSACISTENFDECEAIFDDDLGSCKELEERDGHVKSYTLSVETSCVDTEQIEFRTVLSGSVVCSDLNVLFTNETEESCRRKHRCLGYDVATSGGTTTCLLKCPKKEVGGEYQIELIYGLYPTTWFLCDLKLYQDCSPDPCMNGGACSHADGTYMCACDPGFTGRHCETSVDPCADQPCQHDGTCAGDGGSSYTCNCVTGYDGDNCENNIDDCTAGLCLNGGTCQDGVNSYTCNCTTGFLGATCADVDECASNPCQNGGDCIDGHNSYTCDCISGFGGKRCQFDCDGPWTQPTGWINGDSPVVFRHFQTSTGITLSNPNQIVPGKVCNGVETDRGNSYYADLGDLSAACLTNPPGCTSGSSTGKASYTLWVKITDCPNNGGIISSDESGKAGFKAACDGSGIRYDMDLSTYYYQKTTTTKPNDWFLITFVYRGPNNGFIVYHDKTAAAETTDELDYDSDPGFGATVLGRRRTNQNGNYASLTLDDLTMWNRELSLAEVELIYDMYEL